MIKTKLNDKAEVADFFAKLDLTLGFDFYEKAYIRSFLGSLTCCIIIYHIFFFILRAVCCIVFIGKRLTFAHDKIGNIDLLYEKPLSLIGFLI